MYDAFIMISVSLSSTVMTGENCFVQMLMRTGFSASDFTCLTAGRFFYRPAFSFVQFKPCFSSSTPIILMPDAMGHILIIYSCLTYSCHDTR